VTEAFDESIREILGPVVLESLYTSLEKHYDVRSDELPYRLETAHQLLSDLFGFRGSNTLGRQIARRLYKKLNLRFVAYPGFKLTDYIELAKRRLAQANSSSAVLVGVANESYARIQPRQ